MLVASSDVEFPGDVVGVKGFVASVLAWLFVLSNSSVEPIKPCAARTGVEGVTCFSTKESDLGD